MKPRIILAYCLFALSALCLLAAEKPTQHQKVAKKAVQPETPAKTPWPRNRDEAENAVNAFSASLTKAAHHEDFRTKVKASVKSARTAVSDAGNIDIPEDIIIVFYESDAYQDYFAFYLPPLNEAARTKYNYLDYFQCCKPSFRLLQVPADATRPTDRAKWNPQNAGFAFSVALTRAGYDKDFRDALKASPESAWKKVSDEGNIDIPKKVVMIFHEDQLNEKYHVFSLPPLTPTGQKQFDYHDHFMCCYRVW